MRLTVLTGASESYRPLFELTAPVWQTYAMVHRYQFQFVSDFPAEEGGPAWQKLRHVLKHLPHCDVLFWADADALCTNMKFPVTDYLKTSDKPIIVSQDWPVGGVRKEFPGDGAGATSAMIVRNTPEAIAIFNEAETRIEWMNKRNYDQSALFEAAESSIHLLPRRSLNSIEPGTHADIAEPWERGDFLIHATGVSIEKRIQIVKRHLNNIL